MYRKQGLASVALLIFITLISLSGCKRDRVKLIGRNFEDEVPTVGNLIFTFDRALAPDSIVSSWDTSHYILFEPDVPGRFRWASNSELVFSPLNELPASTAYTATITPLVARFTKFKLSGETQIKFHTPYLGMDQARAYWTANGDDYEHPLVKTDLEFNYDVDPAEVASRLKVLVDGKQQSFTLLSHDPAHLVSLQLLNIAKEDKDKDVFITVDKGLTSYHGMGKTDKILEKQAKLLSPYKLEITSLDKDHDGMEGHILVYTSQKVRQNELETFISLSPEVKFKVQVEDDHFTINSEELKPNQVYTLKLTAGLMGVLGGKLKEDFEEQVSFGELEPQIEILNSKGLFLSAEGAKNLGVNIINVPKVKVTVSKIYENNILSSMSQGYSPENTDESYGEEYGYSEDGYSYYNSDNLGDIIWEKTYDTKNLPRNGNLRLLKLDFEDKLANYKGIYHVRISSESDYWLKDERFISISDIGLIAKRGKDNVFIMANSISTANPMSGVEVMVTGYNNQMIGKAVTGSDGIAKVKLINQNIKGFRPLLVTAKQGSDYTYLPFSKTQVNTSRFDVGGRSDNPAGMECYLYPERNLYRPGESVKFAGIVRTSEWVQPGSIPVKIKILQPDGKDFKIIRKTLNEQGSFDGNFDVPASSVTGTYTVEVLTGNDLLIGSEDIMVEEFMPDRIKVTTVLNKKELGPGESLNINVNAVNYFGPPAADNDYDMELNLERAYFSSPAFPDYTFDQSEQRTYFSPEARSGKTDAKGNVTEVYQLPAEFVNMGKLSLEIFTTVFDENGRPVNRKNTVPVYTQDVFYGIGDFDWWNTISKPVTIPLIAVDKNGKAMNGVKAKVDLIKYTYKTSLEQSGSYYSYRSEKLSKVVENKEISLSSSGYNYSFVPKESGEYEVRIYKPGVNNYVSRRFYAYGYGSSYNSSFEVDNEGNIDIQPDKESYNVGETAKILFKTPFAGKLMVTVERNEVIEHYLLETDKKSASLNVKINDDFKPNVYISATLYKPHGSSELPLTVAHGYAPIKVEDPGSRMAVSINAQKSVRSRTKQTIRVKAAPNAYVTIAAVDEGILAMTNFQTPDPYAFFYAKRALGVNSFDLYPYLFQELSLAKSSTGGDGGNMEKRVNPMVNKRVKLVSFWSGLVKANGNGDASFDIDIPQFSGQLRLMAVSHKDKQLGSAQASMTVADPIVVSSGIPRFLSPGDTLEMPVNISNTTSKNASAKVSLSVASPLKVIGSNSQSADIRANSEGNVVFRIYAGPQIVSSSITVNVSALGETFTELTDITVRPASSLQKITGNGVITAGQSQAVNLNVNSFIPSSVDYKLVIAKSPMVQFTNHLDYLVQYPYGCIEQTVSAAFPQLYYADMCQAIFGASNKKINPILNIEEALRKIKMCQIYNGGLTMWSDGGEETWWGTCYATHFMIEAKKAGYEVDEKVLDKTLGYLQMKLKSKETITYYYNRDQNKKIAPKEVAYSLYVLALGGKPQQGSMGYYKSNQSLLSLDSRYLLAASYFISGDKSKYKEILPDNFSGEEAVQQFGGSFYSAVRDRAIALNALLDMEPNSPQIGMLGKHLTDDLKANPWLNTQERAFAFLALGKMSRSANSSSINADITSGGKSLATYKDGMLVYTTGKLSGNAANIVTKGSGKLYYFWESEGISATGAYKEEDSYLQVRKSFYDRFGRQITGNTFKQNDLVVIKLSLKASAGYVDNVVISDIIPAGFEIENPRISDVPGTAWVKDKSNPDHMDVRDDRINLFVDASTTTTNYYYVVRCVSRGSFKMGPVGADAMYRGEYHSYSGGGMVRITAK